MIETATEFLRLVESDDPADRKRSSVDCAPVSVWTSIVADHPEMRFWVAHNRTVPREVLRLLAVDPDWRVRHRVAARKDCPVDVLELLADDRHDSVASVVAGHPDTPDSALRRLAGHTWEQIRDKAVRRLAERGDGE